MRFRLPAWALILAFLALFTVINGRAYRGYFSDDDLDNLAWTSYVGIDEFGRGFIDPKISPHNFRPVGHIYFWIMGRLAGESFPPYVAVVHALHLGNAVLLWFLLRKLGYDEIPCWIATLVWAFHFALFDAVWKPMYIFDVVCGLFCLLTLHAWLRERWLLAIVAFWCAYKAKEVALFLPAVIALYEFTAGKRRCKPLLPLLAISANFGLQALLLPKGPPTDYTLRFTLEAFTKCVWFYFREAGGLIFAALLIPGLAPERRWSLLGAILLMTPLLFLPGRLFAVYLYVPLLIAAASFALNFRWLLVTAGLMLIWSVYDYRHMRPKWRAYLPQSAEFRSYVTQLGEFSARNAQLRTLIYDSVPAGMNSWGVAGAVHWISRNPHMDVRYEAQPALPPARGSAVVRWDRENRKLIAIISV